MYERFTFPCFLMITILSLLSGITSFYIMDKELPPICEEYTPCGWEVRADPYKPLKEAPYFVYGSCQCPSTHDCIRDSQNTDINSYIYRCKPLSASSPHDVRSSDLHDTDRIKLTRVKPEKSQQSLAGSTSMPSRSKTV